MGPAFTFTPPFFKFPKRDCGLLFSSDVCSGPRLSEKMFSLGYLTSMAVGPPNKKAPPSFFTDAFRSNPDSLKVPAADPDSPPDGDLVGAPLPTSGPR